jgi:copper homeostasis protein
LLIVDSISNQQSTIKNSLTRVLLEVIVQTLADARAAAEGGADRLEVVRAIGDGGLTPPLSLVTTIASEIPLPLRVMVRESSGYEMDPRDIRALQRAAAAFAGIGVDGLVAGFVKAGKLSLADLSVVIEAAPGLPLTFHRAFDSVSDSLDAIDTLAGIPQIDGILTSGGEGTSMERCARLRTYSARAGARVAIMAGAGVDEEAFTLFAKAGCVRAIHLGRAARDGRNPEAPVSAARVRRLRDLADV